MKTKTLELPALARETKGAIYACIAQREENNYEYTIGVYQYTVVIIIIGCILIVGMNYCFCPAPRMANWFDVTMQGREIAAFVVFCET